MPREPSPSEPVAAMPEDQLVRDQEEAAAREAASIGGRPGRTASEVEADEASRPVREAGGGEAEGFEEAERALVEHASHGDDAPSPTNLAGEPEEEDSEAEYGDADHFESSQRDDLDEQ